MNKVNTLTVYLNDYPVGTLTQLPDDRIYFHFTDNYLADISRPILSQSFYTTQGKLLTDLAPTQTMAPSFFANLLPEGYLRDYLAKSAKVKINRDFALLQLLVHDLPGAVILQADHPHDLTEQDAEEAILEKDELNKTILKFSLAGVQLKFSALMRKSKQLTIPAHGRGGDWIIKLPSSRFEYLPENEFSMLTLARYLGIDTPEIQLIEIENIENLPEIVTKKKEKALIVKRFDRENDHRIHMEDFAQVYGIYPHKKYQGVSYNNITNMLTTISGENAGYEFIKRLIFNILIGNSDLHLKNGSLLYRNPTKPELSPAYDYVATHVFINDSTLALSMAGEKDMRKINLTLLKRFAEKVKLPSNFVMQITQETVEKTLDGWQTLKNDLPLPTKMRELIENRLLITAKQFK